MEYNIVYLNGTVGQVSSSCKDWCLEQHSLFNHNEALTSLWLLAVSLIALVIYWAFKNCPEDVYDNFIVATGMTKLFLDKLLWSMITLSMLTTALYIIYFIWSMPKV